jgi:hypothetical protein
VEGADALGLIAEVGIAIAGFAGIIATLRAPGGRIGTYAAFRIGIILGHSATTVLLALFPFALHFAGLDSSRLWALSSSVMAVFVVSTSFLLPYLWFQHVRPLAPENRAPGRALITIIYYPFMAAIAVLQLFNAVFFGQLWPFYVGLLAITAYSLFQFAYVLFAPSRAEVPA